MNRNLAYALSVAATAAVAAALAAVASGNAFAGGVSIADGPFVGSASRAAAPSERATRARSSDCRMPSALAHPLYNSEGGAALYARLPDHCLKSMYLYCSAASERAVLGQDTAMACSLGHEALLKRVFGGDFDALLAWWRNHRAPPPGD